MTEPFCNVQIGNRLDGRRNAEGCKWFLTFPLFHRFSLFFHGLVFLHFAFALFRLVLFTCSPISPSSFSSIVPVVHWFSLSQILLLQLLLLFLLLTCSMMALKIKSERGLRGGRSASPKAFALLLFLSWLCCCYCSSSSCCWLCCHECLAGFLEVLNAICSIQARQSVFCSLHAFCSQ